VPKINKRVIIVKELQNERNFVIIAKNFLPNLLFPVCFVRSTGGTVYPYEPAGCAYCVTGY
jgi:hypothetical protein